MSDDIEARLRRLGNAPVTPLAARRVHELELRLAHGSRNSRRTSWITVAAAATLVLIVVGALQLPRDTFDSLRPAAPDNTIVPTTRTTVVQSTPSTANGTTAPPTAPTAPTQPGTSVTVTTPRPGTTVSVATTQAPTTIPPPSFALSVERVGDQLLFSWPRQSGGGATHYALVRVTADGLRSWPVPDTRIAASTSDLATNSTTLTISAREVRRWVVVVIGDDRRLIAISSTTASR